MNLDRRKSAVPARTTSDAHFDFPALEGSQGQTMRHSEDYITAPTRLSSIVTRGLILRATELKSTPIVAHADFMSRSQCLILLIHFDILQGLI
jgi:hypothetical protein